MKAEILMINDWVSINDSNFQVKVIKKKGVIKLYENTKWGEHEIEFNSDFLEESLQPIPLTSELLEKNGFNRLDQIASIEPYYWFFFDKETEVKIKAFNTIFKGLLVECVNPVNNATTYKQCEFVHEFQHALRLCEIEKEIVL